MRYKEVVMDRLNIGTSCLFIIAALFPAMPGAANAAIVQPTGGTLSGVTPTTVAAAYGPFVAASYSDLCGGDCYAVDAGGPGDRPPGLTQIASISGRYFENGLTFRAAATTECDFSFCRYIHEVSGTLGFDVTRSTPFQFDWSETERSAQNPGWNWLNFVDSLTLKQEDGSTILECVGGVYFAMSGCGVGTAPVRDGSNLLSGELELSAGHYDLDFRVESGYMTGYPSNADFTFSLTAVPIPAALPLWLSGLGLIALLRRL
jgi:hypothetical protein